MKESYTEGLASHSDPESCGGVRKDGTCLARYFSFYGDTSDNIISNDMQSMLWMIV